MEIFHIQERPLSTVPFSCNFGNVFNNINIYINTYIYIHFFSSYNLMISFKLVGARLAKIVYVNTYFRY